MLVLDQSRAISCKATFLQIRKHMEQVHGGHELDNGVTQELKTFIVANLGFGFGRFAETRHNAENNQVRLNGQ